MIRRILLATFVSVQFLLIGLVFAPQKALAAEAEFCGQYIPAGTTGSFMFGFPTWYKYLNPHMNNNGCEIDPIRDPATGQLDTTYLVKVGLAIFEIVLRVAGIAALAFIMYGAFQFLTAQGEPDKYAGARSTVINALIGLVIAVSAVALVNLIGGNIV